MESRNRAILGTLLSALIHPESLPAAVWHEWSPRAPLSPRPCLVEKGSETLSSPHWPEEIVLQTKHQSPDKKSWWGWRGKGVVQK